MAERNVTAKTRSNWTSNILYVVYVIFLLLSLAIVGKIFYLQYIWKPEKETVKYFGTIKSEKTVIPERGDILSCDGKILATSEDLYQVSMDCTIQKANWAKMKNGREKEEKWRNGARTLSAQLAEIYGDRSADEYYRYIISRRDGRMKGRKKAAIGGRIDYQTLMKVKSCALFNEGSNYGGIIVDTIHTRVYPYGSLARKAIGQVKNNSDVMNDLTGIEGKYNYELHGKDGKIMLRRTDSRQNVEDYTRTSVAAENGCDVRTTLKMEFQSIADEALRKVIAANSEIAGGCVMIMECSTGAIRAMANLRKDGDGNIGETYNYVIWQANNPGSVFKTVTLMSLMDDGKVSLDTKVPTFGGQWTYAGERLPVDDYILPYKYPEGKISVGEGLAISSNHVFRYLAATNYGNRPADFISRIHEYKLLEKYDFDINGLAKPVVRNPKMKDWSPIDLPLIAMGYSINVTPLHIISFYNAIANGGKMMKPYMVESFERNGKVERRKGPEVLNGAICKPETARELTRGLLMVTEYDGGDWHRGTGYTSFKGSKVRVAGKTGTSRIEFEWTENGKKHYSREDGQGRHVHQGSFVGFFPAENPQYTVMSVTYTKPTLSNVYGAVSAKVVREIADKLYLLSPQWQSELMADGDIPQMEGTRPSPSGRNEVPELKGLSLGDALYALENSGYKCSYTGYGHVKTQEPGAYTRLAKGETVTISLE